MNKLKNTIDLKALSPEEIKLKQIPLTNLWKVKDQQEQIWGPFQTNILIDYIFNHSSLFEGTLALNMSNEQWNPTFSYSVFQRRSSPSQFNSDLAKSNHFYILLNGQKDGPFSKKEVQSFLDEGKIFSETQISLDNGNSWFKLYEHPLFDRRAKKTNQELPFIPSAEILENNNISKDKILKNREDEDAIYQLASLGQGKKVETQIEDGPVKEEKPISAKTSTFIITSVAIVTLCVFAFAGTFFFTDIGKSKIDQKEASTDEKSIDNSARNTKRKPASVKTKTTRKPAQRVTRKVNRNVRPKRFRAKQIIRPNKKISKRDVTNLEQDIEEIDINDPEVQEEITRQLAGEYELDGEPASEEDNEEFLNHESEDDYNGTEAPIEHTAEDY